MVGCVVDSGWSVTATAQRFQVDAKTERKWRDRFLSESPGGLRDRSSRPQRSPNRTPRPLRRRVLKMRRKRRWGAAHIAFEVGLASSTVQAILNGCGVGRLDRGDRATNTRPARRYQRERPGELIPLTSRRSLGSPMVAGGGPVAAVMRVKDPNFAESDTDTFTLRSMTAVASPTQRSTTMNKPTPPRGSGHGPQPGTRR